MYKSIADSWSDLRGKSIDDCVSSYLGIVRSFPLFGARLFEAKVKNIFKLFQSIGDSLGHVTVTDADKYWAGVAKTIHKCLAYFVDFLISLISTAFAILNSEYQVFFFNFSINFSNI